MNEPTKEEVKLGWMPITWEKLLAGTHDMDATELGGYILLIARQWEKGFVPSDGKRLMKIARQKSKEKMATILEKFIPDGNGNLINKVCDETRQKQMASYLKSSKGGKKGAEKRWAKDSPPIATPIGTPTVHAIADKKKEEIRDTNVSNHHQHRHEEFSKMIFSDAHELDRVNIELQLIPNRLLHEMDIRQFNAHLHTKQKVHETFHEWQQHLRNWINTKPKHKIKNNGNSNHITRKTGHNIVGINETADSVLRQFESENNSGGDTGQEHIVSAA